MLSSLKTAYRDHPRRCGENTSRDSFFLPGKGSPPQVRGKHCNVLSQRTAIGITPAGAGKTYRQHEHVETAEDHPRRCGENPQSPAQIFRALGSPPQVRGKHYPAQFHPPSHGITPAGAGKTLKRSFRNQPFCSGAVQISFNFSNSLNVSLQSGSAR